MDGDDTRRVTELFLIGLFHNLQQTALEVGFPSRIRTVELHVSACERESGLNNRSQLLFAALHRRTRQTDHPNGVVLGLDDRKVIGGLDDVGHLRNNAINTVRTKSDGMDQEILHIFRHLGLGTLHFFCRKMQIGLDTVVLLQPEVFVTVHEVLQILVTIFRDSDDR